MASSLPRILRKPRDTDWSWWAFMLFLQFTQLLVASIVTLFFKLQLYNL